MRRMRIPALSVGFAVALAVVPLQAHHGTGAGYDMSKPITVTGTIHHVEWTNPHCFIYIDVANEKGAVESWALEGGPPNQLTRQIGWTKDTLKAGMKVTAVGFAPRDRYPAGVGTWKSLADALAYSAEAVDRLKTKHVLQVGELRLAGGPAQRYGMGPAF